MRSTRLLFVVMIALVVIVVAGEDSPAASAARDPLRDLLERHEGKL